MAASPAKSPVIRLTPVLTSVVFLAVLVTVAFVGVADVVFIVDVVDEAFFSRVIVFDSV